MKQLLNAFRRLYADMWRLYKDLAALPGQLLCRFGKHAWAEPDPQTLVHYLTEIGSRGTLRIHHSPSHCTRKGCGVSGTVAVHNWESAKERLARQKREKEAA